MARPRLSERLSRGAESALTLVSAPAGFGKTTLLAEWLAAAPADGRSAAWLSLDQRDNDPALFWTYLVAALRTVAPGVGASALSLLQSPQPPIEAVLATLLNDLSADPERCRAGARRLPRHRRARRPGRDGLPAGAPAAADAPGDRQPRRPDAAAGPAAGAWRARRDPRRRSALHARRGGGVPQRGDGSGADGTRTSRRWRGAPKGWIAALQLAALSMQGRDDIAGFIAGFAGDDRYIVDYLVEEVLQRQPEHVRHFLLQTSILDRLSGPLCDAVTGQDDGRAMLEALERGNLFLVPLDDSRQWYRYHHLFADVLRARLLEEQPDDGPGPAPAGERVVRAERRAVRGDPPRAGRRGFRARGGPGRAGHAGAAPGPGRRPRSVAGSTPLPDEVIRVRPVLSIGFAGALLPR